MEINSEMEAFVNRKDLRFILFFNQFFWRNMTILLKKAPRRIRVDILAIFCLCK